MQKLSAAHEYLSKHTAIYAETPVEVLGQLKEVASWDLSDESLIYLEALPALEKLSLTANSRVTDAGIEAMNRLSGLKILVLSGTAITDRGIAALRLPLLEELFLPHEITAAGLRSLGKNNPALRRLHYRSAGDEEALVLIAKMDRLEEIDLSHSARPAPGGLAAIGSMSSLRILEFIEAGLTDGDLKLIRNPALEELSLVKCPVAGPGLADVARLKSLKVLQLSRTQISDEYLPSLTELPVLESLNVSRTTVTDRGLQTIAGIASLRRLIATHLKITGDGIERLRRIPNLNELDVSFSEVDGGVVWAVVAMPGLKKLRVKGTRIGPVGIRWLRWRRPDIGIEN